VTGFGWGFDGGYRFSKDIRIFFIIFGLIKMLSFQDLFIAIIFYCILKSCLIGLNIKIDEEFGFKIFGDDIRGSLYSILKEVFYYSESGEFVLKDKLFLIKRIDF
jgi:hypothetical protein